jgi:Tfp pilus assembly protein PilN
MINLIPDNVRSSNRYAYRNLRLIRYTFISALTMVLILVITGLCILSMNHTQSSLQSQIEQQNQQIAGYKKIQTQGQALSDQLKTINTLLDHQVTFSSLLPDMSKVFPPGAVLQQLDFTSADILPAVAGSGSSTAVPKTIVKKPFIISAAVKDRATAITLLENIRATKDLFSDADLVDISQSSNAQSLYPYQVSINAYFQKDALTKLSAGTTASGAGGSR